MSKKEKSGGGSCLIELLNFELWPWLLASIVCFSVDSSNLDGEFQGGISSIKRPLMFLYFLYFLPGMTVNSASKLHLLKCSVESLLNCML